MHCWIVNDESPIGSPEWPGMGPTPCWADAGSSNHMLSCRLSRRRMPTWRCRLCSPVSLNRVIAMLDPVRKPDATFQTAASVGRSDCAANILVLDLPFKPRWVDEISPGSGPTGRVPSGQGEVYWSPSRSLLSMVIHVVSFRDI